MNFKEPNLIALWTVTFVFLVGFVISILKPWQGDEDDISLSPRSESLRETRNTKSINEKVDDIASTLIDYSDYQDEAGKSMRNRNKKIQRRKKAKKSENSVDFDRGKSENSVDVDKGNTLEKQERKRQKKKARMLRDQEEYRKWKRQQLKAEESTKDPVEQLWEELFRKNLDFKSVFGDIINDKV